MKKSVVLVMCVLAFAGCQNGNREKQLVAVNDSLVTALSQKNAELEDVMFTISEIQEGFQAINQAEGRVNLQAQNAEGAPQQPNLKEDIQFIYDKMEANRHQIEELQKKLKRSGAETDNLKKIVANLTQELNEKVERIAALQAELAGKNIRIAELDSAVVMLTGDVNTLQQTSQTQQTQLAVQDSLLNTGWFVYGTASELKEQRILKKGEVLTEDGFNNNYFTQVDIRSDKSFPLFAKRAKLLTTHPKGSYEFVKDAEKQLTLTILDPQKFWSVSRYVVIEVR